MPNNKSPRLDGYPAEFYKHFWDILFPLFMRVISEIKARSTIPPHMNTVVITLVLKLNKDQTNPANDRPLSLINVELKIISKLLASRLEIVMSSLIHPDQTEFIKTDMYQTTLENNF